MDDERIVMKVRVHVHSPMCTTISEEPDTKENKMPTHRSASDAMVEFCEETTFHGVKYFVKRDLSPLERVFWLACWLTSFIVCCYYIAVHLFFSSPTLTTIHSTTYPVALVGFPSVTFCNLNHIVKGRFPPKQEDVLGSIRFGEAQWKVLTNRVYKNLFSSEDVSELANSSDIPLSTHELFCLIKESSQRCEDMIHFCIWRGSTDCARHFRLISTTYGFCCAINVRQSVWEAHSFEHCPGDKVSLGEEEDAQTPAAGPEKDPIQPTFDMTGAGVSQGLTVLVDAQVKEYSYSTYHSIGFKMHLQEATVPPGMSQEGLVVAPGKEAFVSMRAFSTFTTPAALAYRPNARKCYLTQENPLENYPGIYSYDACLIDSSTTKMVQACGCRDYHMPGTANICISQGQIQCERNFSATWHVSDHQEIAVRCFPRCNKTSYVATPSYARLPTPQLRNTKLGLKFLMPTIGSLCMQGLLDQLFPNQTKEGQTPKASQMKSRLCGLNSIQDLELILTDTPEELQPVVSYIEDNIALVHVYFEESTSTQYKRDVLTSTSQFVANIGGMFGLFLGFSLLSAAELVFYLCEVTVRVASACWNKNTTKVDASS